MSYPSTRLGGQAFNHSQSSSSEAEYDRLRNLARQEHDKMQSCFDRAHQAHNTGDGAEAHSLSEAGKQHQAAMKSYNKQASDFIFRENNALDRVAPDTIDLHGQYVAEAEDILEARIRYAKAQGLTHLHVIVGKGNHSPGHVQKIKPKVEEVCRELGLQYSTEPNAGRIYINLQGGAAQMPPESQWGMPAATAEGYGGQQHQQQAYGFPQQQQQQQYQQQPYQPQQQPQYGYSQQQPQQQYSSGYPGQQQQQNGGYQGKPQQQFQQEQQQEQQDPITSCLKGCCIVM